MRFLFSVLACFSFALGAAAWPQAQSHIPEMHATDTKAMVSHGESIYRDRCAICHYAASSQKKIGPGLRGITKRGKFSDGTWANTPNLTRWIQAGGKNMPGFRGELSDAQIHDLLAYLRTL
jgi:mono/diheme cytochrome c family protein